MNLLAKLILLLSLGVCAFGQLPVKAVDGNGNERVVASTGREFTVYMTTLPTSSTIASDGTTSLSATVKVQLIYCINPTASAATIAITDNQASPVTLVPTVSLPANSVTGVFSSPIGLLFTSGLKWVSGTSTSIACQIQGLQ